MVAHTRYPNYTGGINRQEDPGLRLALGKRKTTKQNGLGTWFK
jgi:hypothetical protein